jgi:hypothetical protein
LLLVVLLVLKLTLRTAQYRIRDFFSRHQDREIRVRAGHDGKDGRIANPQTINAPHTPRIVGYRTRIIITAHAAGA